MKNKAVMLKKKLLLAGVILSLSAFTFQSCIGSFTLTNKVLTWNRNVNNKFVNELVFFAFWVLPVYEVTAIADLLVINSIEFWSGNTPLEARNQVIETEHGKYLIASDETGYDLLSPDGNNIRFNFDKETQTWSMSVNGKEDMDFLRFSDSNHVEVINTQGQFVDVELTREAIDNYKSKNGLYLMAIR